MNLLLIGDGAWGKNYIYTLKDFDINLTVANRNNYQELINNKPDGVIIATPPDSHINIAKLSLSNNIPTLIEKPLALSLNEAKELEQFTSPILVGYLHLFSEAYEKIKQIDISKITSISTFGVNNTGNRKYSSLFDYGPHELAYILDLTNKMPETLSIVKDNKIYKSDRYSYSLTMQFDKFVTNSYFGNNALYKQRSLLVECDGIQYFYNDLIRPLSHKTPLFNMLTIFIKLINGESDNRSGLDLSFKILKLLELCQNKL